VLKTLEATDLNMAGNNAQTLRSELALSEPLCQAALCVVLRRASPAEAAPGNPLGPP
jgi:hypothetical protein